MARPAHKIPKKVKPRLAFHRIPVYGFRLWVGVNSIHNSEAQRKKLDWALGPTEDFEHCCGQVFYNRCKVLVQFDQAELSHSLIAHEVFHIVHRMLDYVGLPLTKNTHESHSYLTGYITEAIYKQLADWKVPINLESPLSASKPAKK